LPPFFSSQTPHDTGETTDPVKQAHIRQIMAALTRNDFNRNAAAKDLGIHKSTLFRRIKKLGITL
jgi:transcriptional regulator with PAS, ATPase and Fis domain